MSDLPPPPPPPPSSDPGPAPTAGPLVPVGPWPRFGARIIDGLVLFIPNAVLAAVLIDDTTTVSGLGSEDIIYLIATTLLGFAYAVWLEASRGQTVGKMALGFKVVGPDGGVPTSDVAMRRNAWLLLGLIPVVGGLVSFVAAIAIGVTIASDPFKRGTHDNIAGGSAVVRSR